jgi:HK97 family phage prohead protease
MDAGSLADLRRSLEGFSLPLRSKAGVNDPDNDDDFDAADDPATNDGDFDPDVDGATTSVAAAIDLHDKAMAAGVGNSSNKQDALLMNHLQDAHEALTGDRVPDGMTGWTKATEALADLRKELSSFRSHSDDRVIAVKKLSKVWADFASDLADLKPARSAGMALEIKRSPINGTLIRGYATTWGTLDSDHEIVDQGAFTASLAERRRANAPVLMLWQHEMSAPIGVWENLVEDSKGLLAEGRILTSVRQGAEAVDLIDAGAISGLSIGFIAKRDKMISGVRHIQAVDLIEISIVTRASNPDARVFTAKEYDAREGLKGLADLGNELASFSLPRFS